ncbi:hypothetical protein TCAL_10968 [Tigriopus californicus]|uniref:Homeobox domain-containing protein n=1 Tax=Tigriopus californicus TaxID=6832 RepID=A0A553NAV3_TIGCA|nr:hypothetical protein TCAL_10968 [Tigriopus californicus]
MTVTSSKEDSTLANSHSRFDRNISNTDRLELHSVMNSPNHEEVAEVEHQRDDEEATSNVSETGQTRTTVASRSSGFMITDILANATNQDDIRARLNFAAASAAAAAAARFGTVPEFLADHSGRSPVFHGHSQHNPIHHNDLSGDDELSEDAESGSTKDNLYETDDGNPEGGGENGGGRFPSGSQSSSEHSRKQRKARTAFTDYQLQTLERSFEKQKYLSVQDRQELAAKLNLTDTQTICEDPRHRRLLQVRSQYVANLPEVWGERQVPLSPLQCPLLRLAPWAVHLCP